ncbi:MAG: NAD(P)H-dependent oxidoreductase subunit E [Chloroflexi bacterium]|nr:NAD(P)H-dependent oxidoreductase subunit E [Chloroflexota bacterium]
MAATARSGESLHDILKEFRGKKGVLLAVLHRVQEAYGYIPRETIAPIGQALNLPAPLVWGSLSFYSEFRTEPPPQTEVHLCLGPTCHLRGADHIKRILELRLGIDPKTGRSPDNEFGVRIMQCPGHCHVAPLMYVNEENVSGLPVSEAAALADRLKERGE